MTKLPPRVYLASQSPRRQELLAQLGVAFDLLLPEAHDGAELARLEALEARRGAEPPLRYVQRVTALKLQAATKRFEALSHRWALEDLLAKNVSQEPMQLQPIICADTTVALGRDILGKPQSADEAAQMLQRLSGQTHRVLTAVAVATPLADPSHNPQQNNFPLSWQTRQAVCVSHVRFKLLSSEDIATYVATGEPFGKAGAYAVQGRAAAFIAQIRGSYSGIMGLPLFETAALLA